MLDAVRAEALKMRRHRGTWLMVWIYPIAMIVLTVGMVIYTALAHAAHADATQTAAAWIDSDTTLWKVPASGAGRLLIAGFVALMFAGEYGWNTWKLIIPARARWQLIVAKWVVAFAFVVGAVIVADIIGMIGDWVLSLEGETIPAGVTLGAVIAAHFKALGHALLPIAYAISFAAMFAILTQSILASMVLSIVLVVVEGLLPLIAVFLYQRIPGLTVALVKGLPFYHVLNVKAWAAGEGLSLPLGVDRIVSLSWGTSVAALLLWIVVAMAITLVSFRRQDLN